MIQNGLKMQPKYYYVERWADLIDCCFIKISNMIFKKKLPKKSDFPEGTEFYIKEFNVPLVLTPSNEWFNWFGCIPREYDVKNLEPGNNWLAESFEEWVRIVDESR